MQAPDHLYMKAKSAVEANAKAALTSGCPLQEMLAKESMGIALVENYLYRAYQIYTRKRNSRIVLESMLFCDSDINIITEKISTHMGVSRKMPVYYAKYFFDVTVFEDLFDKLDYLEELDFRNDPELYAIKEKNSKQMALTEGFEYLISFFKGAAFEYPALEFTKKLLSISNRMVAQAQNSSIISDESKELYKWIALSQKLNLDVKTIRDESGHDALADIKLALTYDKAPPTVENIPEQQITRG